MTLKDAVEMLKALPRNAIEESGIDIDAAQDSLDRHENINPLMEEDGGTVDQFLDEWNKQKEA